MFPVTFNPQLKYCILVPSFSPLFDQPDDEFGVRSSGRILISAERAIRSGRVEWRIAKCGLSDPPPGPYAAISDVDRSANAPGAPGMPRPDRPRNAECHLRTEPLYRLDVPVKAGIPEGSRLRPE